MDEVHESTNDRERRSTNLLETERPLLRVLLLGSLCLEWQVTPAEIEEAWKSRTSARDVFLLLLCMPERQASRSYLAGILWPETEEAKALESLRSALKVLRQVLRTADGQVLLQSVSRRDLLQLSGQERLWVDVDAFLMLVEQASQQTEVAPSLPLWQQARALLRGELLEGEQTREWSGNRWVKLQRKAWLAARRRMIRHLARGYLQTGQRTQAEEVLSHHFMRFPTDQDALYLLMKLLMEEECFEEALSHYERCQRVLANLGKQPAKHLQVLENHLRTQHVTAFMTAMQGELLQPTQQRGKIVEDHPIPLLPPDMPVPLEPELTQEEARREQIVSTLIMQEQQTTEAAIRALPETLNFFELGISLMQLAGIVNGWSQSEFQWRVQQVLGDIMNNEPGMISRRQAISFLIGTSGTVLLPGSLSPHEVLPFCSSNLVTCWQLGKGTREEMFLAKAAVTSYLPALTSLAQQPSAAHQPIAADLAAQCYRLKAILGYHMENLVVAEENAKAAVLYSKIAGEPNLLVTSLVLQALICYYSDRPEKALEKCQQAYLYKNQVTFATQSYLYRMQAVCQAQLDQEKEALTTLELAKTAFSHHPPNEEPFLHAAHDPFELDLWEGITFSHLGSHSAAVGVFERVDPLNPQSKLPERVRTGFLNNLVFAQLRVPASQRDMRKSIALWKASMQKAIDLKSELRFSEAYRAYQEMLVAFPGEQEIKHLRGCIQRWN